MSSGAGNSQSASRLNQRVLASSRNVALIAVVGSLSGSAALRVDEAIVVVDAVVDTVRAGSLSPKVAKGLAVGLFDAFDILFIAIVAQIIGLGIHVLFVDDTLPLPVWLPIRDLDDLKSHLVSSAIAVLTLYLAVKGKR